MIEAVVKSVLSADTLILAHPTKLPPIEKMITLANINAPRYAKKSGDREEPFAYQAREFVRQNCIGKLVYFHASYSNPKTGRDFGHIYLADESRIEYNLGYQLVSRGLATLIKTRSDGTDLHEYMLDAYEEAQQAGKGVHNTDPKVLKANTREPKWDKINLHQIFKKFKKAKSPAQGVVEHVLSGSTVVVQLVETFENVLVHMTGIRCPRIRYKTEEEIGPDGKVQTVKKPDPEPLAQEARHFTEVRLLNRDVLVYLEHVREERHEKSFIGSVVAFNHASTSTQLPRVHQEDLLQKGFARFVDYETYGSPFTKQLQNAELEAKKKRIRLWKDYQEPEGTRKSGDRKTVHARVIEILSGDKIRVRYMDSKDRNEELLGLSCIRAPKVGSKNAQPEPWGFEAREKLRSLIGGNKIAVKVDYRRPIKATRTVTVDGEKQSETVEEERKFATITVNGKNVAIPLVRAGLANVLFRKIDEERSDDYGDLKDLERTAQNNKKGIHGNPKHAPKHFVNDISFKNLGEVQKFAPLLTGKKVKAVVEKVHAAHRFKLFVPKHHCKITFTLSGISVPSLRTEDEEKKAIAQEGLDFATDRLLLRDVVVDINTVNNVGNFLGDIRVNGKDDYVYDLIREGLAQVRTGKFVDRLKNVNELLKAEGEAKQKEIRLYKGWQERQEQAEAEEEEEAAQEKRRTPVSDPKERVKIHKDQNALHQIRITEIIDPSHVFMQTSDSARQLAKIESSLRQLKLDQAAPVSSAPRVGTYCFSKFSFDNQWYRAKVKSVNHEESTADVTYIDFGNTETVPLSDLRILEGNSVAQELFNIQPQVKEVYLAFIAPPQEEFVDDAFYYFSENFQERDLFAKLEFDDLGEIPPRQYVSIFTGPDGKNIAVSLLENGYASVSVPDYLKTKEHGIWLGKKTRHLVEAEEKAKTLHKGQFSNPIL